MKPGFSRTKYAALFFGIFIPLIETIRRWSQLSDVRYFLFWFDDYLFGAFMIFAAVRAIKNPEQGEKFLSAAWGMATAGMFLSLVAQLDHRDQDDPAPISSVSVAWIKGILLIVFATLLIISLKGPDGKTRNDRTNDNVQ